MRGRSLRLLGVAALAAALLAACTSGGGAPASSEGAAPAGSGRPGGSPAATSSGPSVIPVIIGQHQAGPARFVFSFLDADGNLPVGSPDRTAQVAFRGPG